MNPVLNATFVTNLAPPGNTVTTATEKMAVLIQNILSPVYLTQGVEPKVFADTSRSQMPPPAMPPTPVPAEQPATIASTEPDVSGLLGSTSFSGTDIASVSQAENLLQYLPGDAEAVTMTTTTAASSVEGVVQQQSGGGGGDAAVIQGIPPTSTLQEPAASSKAAIDENVVPIVQSSEAAEATEEDKMIKAENMEQEQLPTSDLLEDSGTPGKAEENSTLPVDLLFGKGQQLQAIEVAHVSGPDQTIVQGIISQTNMDIALPEDADSEDGGIPDYEQPETSVIIVPQGTQSLGIIQSEAADGAAMVAAMGPTSRQSSHDDISKQQLEAENLPSLTMDLRQSSTEVTFYQCYVCNGSFMKLDKLKAHLEKKHMTFFDPNKVTIKKSSFGAKCHLCGHLVRDVCKLKIHMMKVHKIVVKNPRKKFICVICENMFTTPKQARAHLRSQHEKHPMFEEALKSFWKLERKKGEYYHVTCPKCQMELPATFITQHVKISHKDDTDFEETMNLVKKMIIRHNGNLSDARNNFKVKCAKCSLLVHKRKLRLHINNAMCQRRVKMQEEMNDANLPLKDCVNCIFCCEVIKKDDLNQHMQEKHSKKKAGTESLLTCPVEGCEQMYSKQAYLVNHLATQHPGKSHKS